MITASHQFETAPNNFAIAHFDISHHFAHFV